MPRDHSLRMRIGALLPCRVLLHAPKCHCGCIHSHKTQDNDFFSFVYSLLPQAWETSEEQDRMASYGLSVLHSASSVQGVFVDLLILPSFDIMAYMESLVCDRVGGHYIRIVSVSAACAWQTCVTLTTFQGYTWGHSNMRGARGSRGYVACSVGVLMESLHVVAITG